MAATNYTPISLYYSSTASATPSGTNLVYGELAINILDGKLFYKEYGTGTVKVLAGTGGTGIVAGSNTQVQFNNSGVFGASSNFTWDGSKVTASAYQTGGNLTFTGTGNRITGDFSNSTVANRVMFQSATANGQTGVIAIPNGTSQQAIFEANSDSSGGTNGSIAQLGIIAGTEVRLISAQRGTGTYLPISFYTNGVEQLRLTTGGALQFSQTGMRITGDFSNATVANRVSFQTSTSNTATGVQALPSGTGTASLFLAANASDPTNASWTAVYTNASESMIHASRFGTGTYLPMTFYTGGSERMRIDTSGNVGIGTSSPSSYPGKLSVIGDGIVTDYDLISRVSSSLADADRGFKQITDGTGQFSIYSPNGGGVVFGVGSSYTERMRIDSSGNVGVGVSPSYPLHVRKDQASADTWITAQNGTSTSVYGAGFLAYQGTSGANYSYFRQGADSNTYFVNAANGAAIFATNSAERMRIDTSGNLLVGTTTATGKVTIGTFNSWTTGATFSGASNNSVWNTGFASQAVNAALQTPYVMAAGGVYAVSDKRVKDNIQPIADGLSFVNTVDPVQFVWKEDSTTDTGFIAQDLLAKGYGHLVSAVPDKNMDELTDENGNVSPAGIRFIVKYDSVVPILCKAIQEQQVIIEQLRADVAELKGQA